MQLVNRYLLLLSCTLFIIPAFVLANEWDGRYSTNFGFRMGAASVCPSNLPINVDIEVSNGSVTGVILNNGGGNSHQFCKLYHNGTISGAVNSDGSVKLKVQQNDAHARQYSSYLIDGKIDGKLRLISRSTKFHPSKSFSLTRNSNTASKKPTKTTNAVKEATTPDFIRKGCIQCTTRFRNEKTSNRN